MREIFYKGRFVFIPVAIVAFLSLISLIVMTLWNNLLPEILDVKAITFWQAMGIFILSKILFGFGKGGRKSGWMRHKCGAISPDERQKFRTEMKERMCGWNRKRSEGDTNPTINN
ncbi:hypothetical protein WG906_19105 [Pedobacter sp. P351]|uniref:hypothetical protein n=1 Tax=Pedobacter superstes TaxID=3133441 RepID=UPI0030A1DED9